MTGGSLFIFLQIRHQTVLPIDLLAGIAILDRKAVLFKLCGSHLHDRHQIGIDLIFVQICLYVGKDDIHQLEPFIYRHGLYLL